MMHSHQTVMPAHQNSWAGGEFVSPACAVGAAGLPGWRIPSYDG